MPGKRSWFSSSSPVESSTPPRPAKRHREEIPSDSPSNPFGLQRRRSFDSGKLPPAISFSKHIALRFTLFSVERDASSSLSSCFRVVQVPSNYSFQHLGKLVEFVFDLDTDLDIDELDMNEAQRLQLLARAGRTWEVMRNVDVVEKGRYAGRIQAGDPWARVSSGRTRYTYRRQESQEANSSQSSTGSSSDDAWLRECKLAREDEFTIGDAWPRGFELTRAVVFGRELPERWTVHITPNTSKVPARKGMGNKPFVFRGAGRGRPNRRSKIAPKGTINVDRYNLPDAFETYIRSTSASEHQSDPFSSYHDISDDEEDTLARIDAAHGWLLRVTREGMQMFESRLKADEADEEAKVALLDEKVRLTKELHRLKEDIKAKGCQIDDLYEEAELDQLDTEEEV